MPHFAPPTSSPVSLFGTKLKAFHNGLYWAGPGGHRATVQVEVRDPAVPWKGQGCQHHWDPGQLGPTISHRSLYRTQSLAHGDSCRVGKRAQGVH